MLVVHYLVLSLVAVVATAWLFLEFARNMDAQRQDAEQAEDRAAGETEAALPVWLTKKQQPASAPRTRPAYEVRAVRCASTGRGARGDSTRAARPQRRFRTLAG